MMCRTTEDRTGRRSEVPVHLQFDEMIEFADVLVGEFLRKWLDEPGDDHLLCVLCIESPILWVEGVFLVNLLDGRPMCNVKSLLLISMYGIVSVVDSASNISALQSTLREPSLGDVFHSVRPHRHIEKRRHIEVMNIGNRAASTTETVYV